RPPPHLPHAIRRPRPLGIRDRHILTSGRGVEAIGNLLSGLAGYGERLLSFGRIVLQRTFGQKSLGLIMMALFAAIGVIMLVRDRRRVREEQSADSAKMDRSTRRKLWWMLAFPPLGYFLLAAKMSPYMVDRYIMPVFPFAAMAVAGLLAYLLGRLKTKGMSITLYTILLLSCFNIFTYDKEYLYGGYGFQLDLTREYGASLPCICIYEGYSFYDNLLEFDIYDRTLLVKPSELSGRQDIAQLPEVMVIYKHNVDGDTMQEVSAILADYGLEQKTFLMRQTVYGDMIIHYVNESLN
ncbi:MAG: hypothetical protein K2K19_07725, partial [Acetatifactor sp.]|nr:hypothetical protein [Acetatifactor sp.]